MTLYLRIRRFLGRLWRRTRSALGFPPPQEVLGAKLHRDGQPAGLIFRNIVIMPGMPISNDINNIDGGPHWPDFDRQTWVRHMRGGKPVDLPPPVPTGPVAPENAFHVWGGLLYPHFGHLVADLTTRLLWSLHRWPDAPFLFLTRPEQPAAEFPDYVWHILEWLGMDRARVRIVDRPLRLAALGVMPQAERVRIQINTWPGYLALLEARQSAMNLHPIKSKILYVGRVGMLKAGAGAHAGESHLVECLKKLGVECLDPASAPLRTQLERYAGAEILIFAEGSAMHGRQLLGRIDQQIVVLNRRPGNARVLAQMRARAPRTLYFETVRAMARPITVKQVNEDHLGLSFYDLDVLFATFSGLGINLQSVWKPAQYEKAKRADIQDWLAHLEPFPDHLDLEGSRERINDILIQENAADLLALHAPALAGQ